MKNKIIALSVLLAFPVLAKEYVLLKDGKMSIPNEWMISDVDIKPNATTPFKIESTILRGGKQEGSQVITITSGDFTIKLSPTRGMGILSVVGDGIRLGWDSPVDEVVNPAFINLEGRGGNGWLDGFNEMLVRCGFEWTGHTVKADGRTYSLHGRAGNTPASQVVINIDDNPPHKITIKGLIKENTFKQSHLETLAELSYVPGSRDFTVLDTLTNQANYARDYQIIYHSNFGTPILEKDAKFSAPVKEISPFNDYAIAGLASWQTYLGPTKDFDEMVFNIVPYADEKGQTLAMLANAVGDKGVGIEYNINQLPVLTLWKNTDLEKQGYVTGIEPGTSYAYPVTIEREQGRVRKLNPGQRTQFLLTYSLLSGKEAVSNYQKRIDTIQGNQKTMLIDKPLAKE